MIGETGTISNGPIGPCFRLHECFGDSSFRRIAVDHGPLLIAQYSLCYNDAARTRVTAHFFWRS